MEAADSPDAIVAAAIAKWEPVADKELEPHQQGWLVARWCPELCGVVYGCRWCEELVQQGRADMPHRCRNKNKCSSFAYGSVVADLKRAIPTHRATKIHEKALGFRIAGEVVAIKASPRAVDAEWKNAAYSCLRSIARLKPADHFVDLCKDAIYVGASL